MKKTGYAFLEFATPIAIAVVVISAFVVYLITHSNNAKFKPMYFKLMSTLNQAAVMAKINPGYDFSEIDKPCSENSSEIQNEIGENHSLCGILNATLVDYSIKGNVSDIKYKYKDKIHTYSISTDVLPQEYKNYIVYALKDGSYIGINREAKVCELPIATSVYNNEQNKLYKKDNVDLNRCIGFVDVNGPLPPNKEVYCTKGKNIMDANSDCVVDMRQNKIADVYPILFYNTQVVPLTAAAKKAFLASKAK